MGPSLSLSHLKQRKQLKRQVSWIEAAKASKTAKALRTHTAAKAAKTTKAKETAKTIEAAEQTNGFS
jgi:hypothetical protein